MRVTGEGACRASAGALQPSPSNVPISPSSAVERSARLVLPRRIVGLTSEPASPTDVGSAYQPRERGRLRWPPARVALDLAHEVRGRKAIGLAVLGHDVADIDDLPLAGSQCLGDAVDEQAGNHAGVQVAGTNEDGICPLQRLAGQRRDGHAWL